MTIGMTLLYTLVFFPMWGGMFCPAKPGVTEEDYYVSGLGLTVRHADWQYIHMAALRAAHANA